MFKINKIIKQTAISFLAAVSSVAMAQAATLEITVTNTADPGGFAISPVYMSFHDGSFDAFDEGSAASTGMENIAETGNPVALNGERLTADPNSVRAFVFGPSFPPVPTINAGESVTTMIDIDGSVNPYFSYVSMLAPTNDTFLGNDDPLAFALFDGFGTFLGDRVITVLRSDMWDAGTEVNDPSDGAAFLAGVDGTLGTAESGVVHAIEDLSAFAGLASLAGPISDGILTNPDAFVGVTISIRRISTVPLPASGLLLIGGLAGLGSLRRHRRVRK